METTIEVKNLCKSYAGIKAAENVNISICRGEVFGLLGANGAGKSTTIECILGTKKQDSGTVQEAITASPYEKFEDAYLWYTDEEEIENESI